MAKMKEFRDYNLMNDEVVRPLFKNSKVARELTAKIISEVTGISYNILVNNITFINDDRAFSVKNVDSRTDVLVETPSLFVNLEICYTRGSTREKQTDSYTYEIFLNQAIKSNEYKNMKNIIQIMIENYDFFNYGLFRYKVVNMEETIHLIESDNITKYHINLDLLKDMSYNSIREETDTLKKIMYMFVCEQCNLDKAYEGDDFMTRVVKEAREISGKLQISLYLPESEIRRFDCEMVLPLN